MKKGHLIKSVDPGSIAEEWSWSRGRPSDDSMEMR